jgi:hypothetical protein
VLPHSLVLLPGLVVESVMSMQQEQVLMLSPEQLDTHSGILTYLVKSLILDVVAAELWFRFLLPTHYFKTENMVPNALCMLHEAGKQNNAVSRYNLVIITCCYSGQSS